MPEARVGIELNTVPLPLPGRGAQTQQAFAYARACWPDGTAEEQRLLALHLATILALDDTLETGDPLPSATEEQRALLPWCQAPCSFDRAQEFASRKPVREALAHLDTALVTRAALDPSLPTPPLTDRPYAADSAILWWRKQGEVMVAAIWQEALWRTSGILPDEGLYLAVAEVSIGIGWIVATLLLLDGARLAPRPDSLVVVATAAVAAAIRVANDLHETRRERREGKMQLLFLRTRALQALGYRPRSAQRRARQELLAELSRRVTRARALLDDQEWCESPRLRSGLLGMLGAALGMIHIHEPAAADPAAIAREPRR
ncbi:MAG TPA: hypothetical protein VGL99_28680 [Chloroflexota bacterium]|jgi:hypothetical protein